MQLCAFGGQLQNQSFAVAFSLPEIGYVARRTGDKLHFALVIEDGNEHIFVDTALAVGAGKRRFVAHDLPSFKNFLYLMLKSRRQIKRVIQIEKVLTDDLVQADAEKIEQRLIGINKAPFHIENISEIFDGIERRVHQMRLLFGATRNLGFQCA